MQIAIEDSVTLRLSFVPAKKDVAFVKSLRGGEFDPQRKTWLVPLHHYGRIVDAYPAAVVVGKQEIEQALVNQCLRLVWQYNAMGVWFSLDYDCETVVPVGDGVSPAFVDWVRQHSAKFLPHLGDQYEPVRLPRPRVIAAPTKGDQLMQSALVGGHAAEQRKAEMAERRKTQYRRSKRDVVQGKLL